jgi:hypothetical protein
MKYLIVSISLFVLMMIILIVLLPFFGNIKFQPPYSYIMYVISMNLIFSIMWAIRKEFISAVKDAWNKES